MTSVTERQITNYRDQIIEKNIFRPDYDKLIEKKFNKNLLQEINLAPIINYIKNTVVKKNNKKMRKWYKCNSGVETGREEIPRQTSE